jgi:hypothetical protein
MAGEHRAFTQFAKGRERVLPSRCFIAEAHDPRKVPEPARPKFVEFVAIWDTGATGSVITQPVVDACGLKPTGMALVSGVHGQSTAETFLVNIALQNGVAFQSVQVTKGELEGFQVLIGMDIISMGDFAVSNFEGKTAFTFRIPSQATTDFVAEMRAKARPGMNVKIGAGNPSGIPFMKRLLGKGTDAKRGDEQAATSPPAQAKTTPGRNDPCYCGSGRKYKKCHGAAANP